MDVGIGEPKHGLRCRLHRCRDHPPHLVTVNRADDSEKHHIVSVVHFFKRWRIPRCDDDDVGDCQRRSQHLIAQTRSIVCGPIACPSIPFASFLQTFFSQHLSRRAATPVCRDVPLGQPRWPSAGRFELVCLCSYFLGFSDKTDPPKFLFVFEFAIFFHTQRVGLPTVRAACHLRHSLLR